MGRLAREFPVDDQRTVTGRFLAVALSGSLCFACARGPTEPTVSRSAEDGTSGTPSRQVIAAPSGSDRAPSTVSRLGGLTVPQGNWGGPSVNLTVTPGGGTIEFDCGRGTIDLPMLLDANGRFDVAGTFVREGGPEKENPDRIPARYAGSTDGRTLILTVSADGFAIGPLTLALGAQTRLLKCL